MGRWPAHLVRKYFTSHPRNLDKLNISRNIGHRYRKHIFIGLGGGLATIAIGAVNADKTNIVVGASGFLRFIRSIKIGLGICLDYYFSMIGLTEGTANYDVMMSRIHQRCATRIRDGCLQNGGTYVKLGQGLVSLSHILPKEYISTLKILQDKCLARDKTELYQVFQEEFGRTPEELFESFDICPIAAASIAQVFKATTKEGRAVAVKVQYNDLRKRLKSDVLTINVLLNISAWLHPKVDFTWVLNDFVDALKQELDFVNEGLNGERCAKDLAHLKYVHIPAILWRYTNTRVLVTEFIEGIKINDINKLKENGFSLADINKKLFESFGYQIFQTGFVHADPHPGNVLIRNCNGRTELVILDHGLYQMITREERLALSHLWKAIVFGDHAKMQTYSKTLGVDDYTMFAEILTQAPLRSMNFKLKIKLSKEEEEYMKKTAGERFDHIVDCLQQMPRSLLLIVRNLNTIRAISYDHGCPIDRYAILSRMATKAAFATEGNGLIEKFLNFPKKIWFETHLLIIRFTTYWRLLFWNLFCTMGLVPDISAIMKHTAREL